MGNPRLGMVVELYSVVDRAWMLVGVVLLHDSKESVPISHSLLLHHVIFISHRPPHVPKSYQAREDVAQITIVSFTIHCGITPVILRMEENDVSFDTKLYQVPNPLLEMLKESGVESCEVPAVSTTFKWVIYGFVPIEDIVLGENTHPQFVECCRLQCCQCLFFQNVSLMDPGIAGGADGVVRRTVGINEVICVMYMNRTMVRGRRFDAGEFADFAIQVRVITPSDIPPYAEGIRHKTDTVDALPIVKPVYLHQPIPIPELGTQLDIQERIAAFGSLHGGFKNPPAFNPFERRRHYNYLTST